MKRRYKRDKDVRRQEEERWDDSGEDEGHRTSGVRPTDRSPGCGYEGSPAQLATREFFRRFGIEEDKEASS